MTPEIHPHDTLNGSSLRLPFKIKNISIWPINNARMTCGIDWTYFIDARRAKMNLMQLAFVNDVISIAPGQTVNYTCDASELISAEPDGSWKLRTMTGPFWLFPPLDFKKMCIWIKGDYKVGLLPWTFTSEIFEWPSAPDVPQWLEGPTYREHAMTPREWLPERGRLPPDVVTCAPTPGVPAIIFNGDGTALFEGKILKVAP
jgi:hypothetical protein